MKRKISTFSLIFCALMLATHLAEAKGVEDLLVDFGDYLTTRLIPAAAMVGVGIGSVMLGTGNQKGMEFIKYSIVGGILGTAGALTMASLFF